MQASLGDPAPMFPTERPPAQPRVSSLLPAASKGRETARELRRREKCGTAPIAPRPGCGVVIQELDGNFAL